MSRASGSPSGASNMAQTCGTVAVRKPPAADQMRSLRTAQALYGAVSARYSSPATAALGRLLLPYPFPELSAFATVEDLGCSPSPLAPSYASAAAIDVPGAEDVGAASASRKHRKSKGKGGRGGGGGSRGGSGGSSGGGGSGGSGGGIGGVVVVGLELSVEVLEEARGSGRSVRARPRDRAGQTCGKPYTQHHCFSRLDDAWRTEFGDEVERPHWAEVLRSGVAIFDLDYDAILSSMYALSVSAEGDCYQCVPPDPGIEAAALGASESSLCGTAPAEALHTFTLDSGASRCFFHDSTTLTPLPTLVLVRLADPSGGPDVARSSIVLPCLAVLSGSL
ncbi:unnamed protein product [Closterium sp. NIES-54]